MIDGLGRMDTIVQIWLLSLRSKIKLLFFHLSDLSLRLFIHILEQLNYCSIGRMGRSSIDALVFYHIAP